MRNPARIAAALVVGVVLLASGCTSHTRQDDATTTSSTARATQAGDAASAAAPIEAGLTPKRRSAALAELATLPVKGRAPKTGYERAEFGPAWTDDVTVAGGHDGCDTRNDILARDLTSITYKPGSHDCTVLTGTLHDPYTGRTITFQRGVGSSSAVQIDHVVALSDAWQKGAQQLTQAQRRNLANDPLNLQAVDGPTNESKGAGDAATWLPPNKAYRCTYVSRQVTVKAKYHLWVTQAEHDAIARILRTCGKYGGVTPGPTPSDPSASSSVAAEDVTPRPETTTSCFPLSNGGHCYRLREFCAKRYRGTHGVSADGEKMACRDNNGWRWQPL